jgi:hypothetical protein
LAYKLGRHCRQAVISAECPFVFDPHRLAFDIAAIGQSAPERRHLVRGIIRRPAAEESNHQHRRLLRARRERPRDCRAAKTETSLRIQYFLEKSISEDKNNYYGRVHCNDEPKQNTSLGTQPLYFISGLSEFL